MGGVVIALVLVYSPRARRSLWQGVGLSLVALAFLAAVAARTLVLT